MTDALEMLLRSSKQSLKTISKETGIAYPTLSSYKQGVRKPKNKNAKILANYFGVPVSYLTGLKEPKKNIFSELARNKGKSLKEISVETGIGYSTIGNYNQGSVIPNSNNALILANYFGVSLPYLLGIEQKSVLEDSQGNRLKLLRIKKGLTQSEVAEILNINQSQYGKYENGKTNLSIENAKKLADYFGVSVAYLLDLENMDSKRDNQIPRPIPFYNDLNLMLSEFRDSRVIESYIDFISKDKKYNPILLKAFKQFIVDEEGYFLTLISESSENNSPYHYVWEEWNKEKIKNHRL